MARIDITREEALAMGIVFCTCKHPPNKHFEHDARPCAACDCKKYVEQWRIFGRIVKGKKS